LGARSLEGFGLSQTSPQGNIEEDGGGGGGNSQHSRGKTTPTRTKKNEVFFLKKKMRYRTEELKKMATFISFISFLSVNVVTCDDW
jgi:hypothetical protein